VKGTDRFLIAIVAGVVILVVVVFALTLLRVNAPQYQAEDTPQSVVHNYLVALQLEEYERARSYLSPTLSGYPADADQFAADIDRTFYQFGRYDDVSLAVESANVQGDTARVFVHKIVFYRDLLFETRESSSIFDVTLRREGGAWKITTAEQYWTSCWTSRSGLYCR
jgi:hypothetical protein